MKLEMEIIHENNIVIKKEVNFDKKVFYPPLRESLPYLGGGALCVPGIPGESGFVSV